MNTKLNTKNLCLAALFTAIVCLVTRFIQIPIPLGYFNIGNCIILTFCYLLPCPYGIVIGSAGSALADLLSFPEWAIPTLIIKAAMPLMFYALSKIPVKKYFAYLIAGIVSMLIPFAGYTFTGALLYGSLAAGLSQIPGLALEYIANCVLFGLLLAVVEKSHIKNLIIQETKNNYEPKQS